MRKDKLVLIAGWIGIIGALITVISDFILIGKPTSAYIFFKLGTESMAGLPPWRITIGTFLGVGALPFQIAGLVTIYYGLKPAGKWRAIFVFGFAAHALIMGVAFHVAYGFIGNSWRLYYEMGLSNALAIELVKRFGFYWNIITSMMLTDLALCSVGFSYIILKGKTLYPKWMAIFSPFCVFLFLFSVILGIPAPVGGYVASAFFNTGTVLFFALSTYIVYKKIGIEYGNER